MFELFFFFVHKNFHVPLKHFAVIELTKNLKRKIFEMPLHNF